MSDLFTRMCCRMDVATVRVMGKQAEINGVVYDVMPEEESAEMGALSGSQLSLVVFSARYRPARHDVVVFAGRTLTVTRYDTYNGKPGFCRTGMSMAIKGLAQAMKNLDAIDRRAVPRASATTLNRVAGAIIAKTASSVARSWPFPVVLSVPASG